MNFETVWLGKWKQNTFAQFTRDEYNNFGYSYSVKFPNKQPFQNGPNKNFRSIARAVDHFLYAFGHE